MNFYLVYMKDFHCKLISMKGFISLILLFLSLSVKADYRPLALHEMIIKADKIVYGMILEIDSTHYKFKVEGGITKDTGIIRIQKFQDWLCAWRWTEYQIGQEMLVFLATGNGGSGLMGAGNEGELPIMGNSLYINGSSLNYVNGSQNDYLNENWTFPGKRYKLYGGEYYGTKMNVAQFLKTIKYVRRCFNFEYGVYGKIKNWKLKCNYDEILKRSKASLLIKAILRVATKKK